MPKPKDAHAEFESALERSPEQPYILRLYIAGSTPNSARALENIKGICEQHLAGRYDLEVVDIFQQPVLAKHEQIVAVPTLIKQLPPPLRKLIGDLTDRESVLIGLDLRAKPERHAKEDRGKKRPPR
jgi:circadian clock protein KaiB